MLSLLCGNNAPQFGRSSAGGNHPDSTMPTANHEHGASTHQPLTQRRKRIVLAMTSAAGAVLGIKCLVALRRLNVETRMVLSKWA